VRRSAVVLRGLQNPSTGAITAAPTTSLPETPGGDRNWDYRASWIRDSTFAVRSLAVLGADAEADQFRRFVERSAAGSIHSLQIAYGLGANAASLSSTWTWRATRALRYRPDQADGDSRPEGAFIACSFWLVECLAQQGRIEDARELFDQVSACGNDLGLFSEEYDSRTGRLLGNHPQGLSHLSHITAALALGEHDGVFEP
jgi:pentatricopeptide repeat protein